MTDVHDGARSSPLTVWRSEDREPSAWRNGGGVTWEVARAPDGTGLADFDWRISCAEVAASGPFSTFDGVDRTILLIAGDGMALTIDGVRHELARYEPLVFDGASTTDCELTGASTRDLNVMTTRGRCEAAVEVVTLARTHRHAVEPGDPLVLLVLEGEASVNAPQHPELMLGPLDGARWSAPSPVTIDGVATVAVVRLHRTTGSSRLPRG